jgi:uncharacterized membrane protein
MNKTVKLIFLGSMVLNVLFSGILLGQLPNRLGRDSFYQRRIDTAAMKLPEPSRAHFRQKMGQVRSEVQPLREQLQEARNEAIRAFTAEPFDEAAYDRQIGKISELRRQMSKRMAATMKEIAKELPLEERQALAEAFKRPPTHRGNPQ